MRLAALGNALIKGSLVLALAGTGSSCKKDPARRYLAQGDRLLRAQQYTEAAEHYRQAAEARPNDAKLWERHAFALMHSGQTDAAAEALLRTRDLEQDNGAKAGVLRKVAMMYLDTQDLPKAEQYLLEAVELEPGDTASLMWLGEIESARGGARSTKMEPKSDSLGQAIAYYDRVLAAEPDSLLATVNKRIAVLKLIRFEQERQQMERQVLELVHEPARRKEARERLAEHAQSLEELQGRSLALRDRIAELKQQGKTLSH
jgi:tetratricopeptide (TPR) repeat protein